MTLARPPVATPNLDDFYRQFASERTTLQDQIDQVGVSNDRKSAVDACLLGISELSKRIQDASDFLPSWDQRSYADSIKTLSARLQNARQAAAPRSRFSFKNKLKATQRVPSGGEPRGSAEPTVSVGISRPTATGMQEALVADLIGDYRRLSASPEDFPTSVNIQNINSSIIDTASIDSCGRHFATLACRDIADSVLLCGHVEGPIHVTKLTHSLIVASCRQFRMHEASDCDVYLHCGSNPIIEHCSNVRFAPLPEHLKATWGATGKNVWGEVNDFNWLRAEASPNWCKLPESERLPKTQWHKLEAESVVTPSDISNALCAVGLKQSSGSSK